MAGNVWFIIDAIQLRHVYGGQGPYGLDKQTRAAQRVIAAAVSSTEDLARATAPKDTSWIQMMMQMLPNPRSRSGPTSAPALPPAP